MFDDDIQKVISEIKAKIFWLPEYFYAKHPNDRAPIRIMVNSYSPARRSRLGNELRARGFVVRYWTPKLRKGFG